MKLELDQQEVQGLIDVIGNIPTKYGKNLMLFFEGKIEQKKIEIQQKAEEEAKKPNVKKPSKIEKESNDQPE